MISKILNISSNKSLKPSGKVKGIVISSKSNELVVKINDSTVNLSVPESDIKVGDAVSISFSRDTVNLQKIIPKLHQAKDQMKFESSDVIRNILSQIDHLKSIDNLNLQKTLSALMKGIKNEELHISLLVKSIGVLENEKELIKLNTGNSNKEIDKLISILSSLKESLSELKKSELLIENSSVRINVEGDFKPLLIIKETINDVKNIFNKLGISDDLLKGISSKSGPFLVSITPDINLKEAVIDVAPEKYHVENMKDLQQTFFQSSQLKDVAPEILLDILKNLDAIKPELLTNLDNFFKSSDKQISFKDGVMRLLLPQIALIFNTGELDVELLNQKLLPITDENLSLQLLDISKNQDIEKFDLGIEKVLKDMSSVAISEDKKNIIPLLFKMIGLSNERDVLKLVEGANGKLEFLKQKRDAGDIITNIIQIVNNTEKNKSTENDNVVILQSTNTKNKMAANISVGLIPILNKEIVKFSDAKIQATQIAEKIEAFQNQIAKSFMPSIDIAEFEKLDSLKSEAEIHNDNIKIVVKGDFRSQLIVMDNIDKLKIFLDKIGVVQDITRNLSPKGVPFVVSITPNVNLTDAIINIYSEKAYSETLENKQDLVSQSTHSKNISSDILLELLKNNKNPDIISDILNLINQLKKLPASDKKNFPKVLIDFAKSMVKGQPSISMLNKSITLLEKENSISKLNERVENKEISKLTSILSSLKDSLQLSPKVEHLIKNDNIKILAEGNYKPQLIFMDKIEDVKLFLNKMEIPKEILKSISSKVGPFMLSITPTLDSKEAIVNIYPEKNQLEGLANIKQIFFESPQLKNALPDQLLKLLRDVEIIKPESSMKLDDIFKSIDLTGSKISLRDEVMRILFPQFNTSEFNNDILKEKLLPLMDEKLSQQLINVTKNNDIRKFDPQIEKILKELSTVITSENKRSLISGLFKLTDLLKEGDLIKLTNTNPMSTDLLNEKNNIKSILIKMLQIISKAENDVAIENKDRLTQDKDIDYNKSLNEQHAKFASIKKQVSQVIEKIEAFQVLAKSVPMSSGESQLLTLPVNFGGEWVDLQLRLSYKKRDSSKGNDKKRITVELNIELSAIGEVSAEMEYFKNKEISINLVFNNKKVVNWFELNKSKIEEALQKLDLNIIKLNFRSNKSFIKPEEITPKHINSNFDIVG